MGESRMPDEGSAEKIAHDGRSGLPSGPRQRAARQTAPLRRGLPACCMPLTKWLEFRFLTRTTSPILRSVAKGGPINGRDPTVFLLVEVSDAFSDEFIRLTLLIGVIHIERQDQSVAQFDPLSRQVLASTRTSESQSVDVVQVLKVGINLGGSHRSKSYLLGPKSGANCPGIFCRDFEQSACW